MSDSFSAVAGNVADGNVFFFSGNNIDVVIAGAGFADKFNRGRELRD